MEARSELLTDFLKLTPVILIYSLIYFCIGENVVDNKFGLYSVVFIYALSILSIFIVLNKLYLTSFYQVSAFEAIIIILILTLGYEFISATFIRVADHLGADFLVTNDKAQFNINCFSDRVYFAIMTSTTLGYGEVVPNNFLARMIVSLMLLITPAFIISFLSNFISIKDRMKTPLDRKIGL